MNALDNMLSQEVISGIIIIFAFAMCIRTILSYTNEASELRPKISEIDRKLNSQRNGMKNHQSKVEKLSETVRPLKEREALMRAYYDQMKDTELEQERKQMADQADEEDKRDRPIQRKSLGDDI